MSKKRSVSRAFAALSVIASSLIVQDAFAAPIELQECRLQTPLSNGSAAARCGVLDVAENRADPTGKHIAIHVAVIPALRSKPEQDPLFLLSGGPGQAASDMYLSLSPVFSRIRQSRDLVIVDQRGTGKSNRLDCTLPDDSELISTDPEQLHALTRKCIASLSGDPRFYTTSIAVRDLDEVRAGLGYERIDLYGVSYGTRVAQHYMRRYPNRVRAVILDGVVPPEMALGPDVAIDAQHALDRIFARCGEDPKCNERFPTLAEQFHQLQLRLQHPEQVQLADPLTAQPTTTPFGLPELTAAIRLLSYTDETASTLPLLIAGAKTDLGAQALAAQYLMIRRSTSLQIAYGMHFAVVCSEDAPRWSQSKITDADLERTYIGVSFMQSMRSICSDWPRGEVDADFSAPLQNSIPTLLLSGGNDPVTPARYAERAARGLANSRQLVLKDQGHGQIAVGCMPQVVTHFIEAGSVKDLDVKCLDHVAPAAFLLTRTATAP
ncbi:MAG TPA: alpha/beta hydrolase [Steroidobacteraceae bacterium]|nr:alpha/beta hydrolase [Steroidobacteraceae bacterium]